MISNKKILITGPSTIAQGPVKHHHYISTNVNIGDACAGPAMRARRVASAWNRMGLIFWVPFVSRQKVHKEIINAIK